MNQTRFRIISIALLVLAAFTSSVSQAQESSTQPTHLQPYIPAAGQITSDTPAQVWTFSAQAESAVSIVVEATAREFDPTLQILDPDGRELLANDDYNYPATRDALLEAVTIPRMGTYQVVVSGFNNSTGTYRLTMTPGYSRTAARDVFDGAGNWQTVNETGTLSFADGAVQFSTEGVQQTGVAVDLNSPSLDNFYVEARVAGITARNTWAVGLVLRYRPDGYTLFAINGLGQWRVVAVEGGTERILRDWTPHPAILPGETNFTLSAFVNGTGIDLFFNNQIIGQVNDSISAQAGQIGLMVMTANALSSQVSARFDDLGITQPVLINGERVFPQRLIQGTQSQIVRDLERRGLIPTGGQLVLNVSESFVSSVRPGVILQPLGRGVSFGNFVLATTATLAPNSRSGISGCGLLVRSVNDTNYMVAYVDSSGAYGLSERTGDTFQPGIYTENAPFVNIEPNTNQILVIAVDDILYYYVNGRHAGTLQVTPAEGQVGNALVNFDPGDNTCQFSNSWLWRWGE